MQIGKSLINDPIRNSKVSWKFRIPTFIICSNLPVKFAIFLKSRLLFNNFYSLLFTSKTLRLNNFKTRTAMNAKISVFVIYIKAIIYLLLYNLHDCTFNCS